MKAKLAIGPNIVDHNYVIQYNNNQWVHRGLSSFRPTEVILTHERKVLTNSS